MRGVVDVPCDEAMGAEVMGTAVLSGDSGSATFLPVLWLCSGVSRQGV